MCEIVWWVAGGVYRSPFREKEREKRVAAGKGDVNPFLSSRLSLTSPHTPPPAHIPEMAAAGMDWDALLAQSEELAAGVSRAWGAPSRIARLIAAVFFCMHRPPHPPTLYPDSLTTPITQDAHGFPRVERDLAQVERFSASLKERTARVVADAGADRAAAARLLAAEGVNTRR
jgi:hypothetical protein